MSKLPSFIGIGAPKCATTYLDSQLRRLPDVYLPLEKEPNFFSHAYWRGLDEYRQFFNDAPAGKIIGEFSTSYFHHEAAAERIKKHCPSARLILAVRNPVEQVYSMYWQCKRHNFYQNEVNAVNYSFGQALVTFPDVLLAPARYGTNLQNWLNSFDRDCFFIVVQEKVRDDFPVLFTDLCRFIGATPPPPSFYAESSERVFSGVSPRSSTAAKIYGMTYRILNEAVFFPLKNMIGYKRAHYLKEQLKIRSLLGKLFFKPGYPQITEDIRNSITDALSDEILLFEELSGLTLEHWNVEGHGQDV